MTKETALDKVAMRVAMRQNERIRNIEKEQDKLAIEKDKQLQIIIDAGRGSRRADTAQKKIGSIKKRVKKLQEMDARIDPKARKDYELIRNYGESAMEARSFGTDRKAVKKDYAKGGLIGPAYRHSNKDYRKGGLFK
jgi:phage-related minor tail protein